MEYSQKYTLVAFVDPVNVGREFDMSDWPLHITLADVFAIDRPGSNIEQSLRDRLKNQSELRVVAKKEAHLGDTEAVLLEKTDQLYALHLKVVDLLTLSGAKFNSPEFTRTGFIPHSTVQKSGKLIPGDEVLISQLALVDMFVNNNWQQRRVLSTFELKETNK